MERWASINKGRVENGSAFEGVMTGSGSGEGAGGHKEMSSILADH
jgi:hypothetical protein